MSTGEGRRSFESSDKKNAKGARWNTGSLQVMGLGSPKEKKSTLIKKRYVGLALPSEINRGYTKTTWALEEIP